MEVAYLSTGNVQINLALVRADQDLELLNYALQQAQSIVLGERAEEVLDDVALVAAGNLLQLLDDLLLVADGEGGGVEDGGELGVLLEDVAERQEGLGDCV
jgi:hypothetical protein